MIVKEKNGGVGAALGMVHNWCGDDVIYPIYSGWEVGKKTELQVSHYPSRGRSKYGWGRTFKVLVDLYANYCPARLLTSIDRSSIFWSPYAGGDPVLRVSPNVTFRGGSGKWNGLWASATLEHSLARQVTRGGEWGAIDLPAETAFVNAS